MKNEFNLSEERIDITRDYYYDKDKVFAYTEEDVKEFIKLLKEYANPCMKCGSVQCAICFTDIDKLAGDKLK